MEPTNDLRSGRPNEPRESIVPLLERHSISELVAVLQESAEKHLPQLDSILHDLLLKSELTVFEEVNQLAFKEGSWFRPIHNRVVPLCMLHIISATDCQRDLMYPALNHDAGMSLIAIECTHAGADWENKDKRKLHMELGAAYCRQQLTNLQAQGTLLITAGRINQLAEIVGTHDNPYLGIDLVAEEAKLVRDADRCFVMSFTSFWKDFLAYRSDDNYLERYRAQGLLLLPQDLLAARLAFFYDSFESFPTVLKDAGLKLNVEFAALNEGGRCEPCFSAMANSILEKMFLARAKEVQAFLSLKSLEAFKDFVLAGLDRDYDAWQ